MYSLKGMGIFFFSSFFWFQFNGLTLFRMGRELFSHTPVMNEIKVR